MKIFIINYLIAATVWMQGVTFLYGASSALPLPQPKNVEEATAEETSSPVGSETDKKPTDMIASGEPVIIEDKGITITPPTPWTYTRDYPGSTLLMQAPIEDTANYRRTIQITSYAEPLYLTESNMQAYETILVKRFSSGDSSISNYKIRNHMPVTLEGGLDAHLYYAEFSINGAELMQMHVVVSAENRHFVLTFTDLAEYFDVEKASAPHLNQAWEVMNSVKLSRPVTSPIAPVVHFFAVAAGLFLLGVAVTMIKNKSKKKQFDKYADAGAAQSPVSSAPATISEAPISFNVKGSAINSLHESSLDTSAEDDYGTNDDEMDFKEIKPSKKAS